MTRTRLGARVSTLLHSAAFILGMALVWSGSSSFAFARAVPEIDPGSATSALTLLAGGVLLLKSRLRSK
jgi:hypothetical protein